MKNKKDVIIIVVGSVFIVILLLLIMYFRDDIRNDVYNLNPNNVNNVSNVNNNSNLVNNNTVTSSPVYSKVERISEYNAFYNSAMVISKMLETMSFKDEDVLYDILDEDYLKEKRLIKSTAVEYFNPNEYMFNLNITDEYYSCNNKNCYYFVKLNGLEGDTDVHLVSPDKFYLLLVDLVNETFSLRPIDGITNLKDYALKYKLVDRIIPSNKHNKYSEKEFNKLYIINYYLSYARYLLFYDQSTAANYMDVKYFDNLDYYATELGNIVYSYKSSSNDIYTEYKIVLHDGCELSILDYSPMKFKIVFK